jgi:hypothetical protein
MRPGDNQRGADAPIIIIEGIEEIPKRDLAKHKMLVVRTRTERDAYAKARSHEVRKKKHYRKLIGGGKFNDDALRASIQQIIINIRHFSDKVKASEEKLVHHQLIVETLTRQLEQHEELLKRFRLATGR